MPRQRETARLLPVGRDPVVHCVALVDHQVGVSGLGSDRGPPVGELAAGHDDLEPATLPGHGMLHQPQQRQRARGRCLSRHRIIESLDIPGQPLALGELHLLKRAR